MRSDCVFTLDVETRERRPSVAEDVRRFAQLCDGLDQIDFVMSMGIPSDVPTMDHYLHSFIQMIRGSVKPNVYTAKDRQDMEDIYHRLRRRRGEGSCARKPFMLLYAEPILHCFVRSRRQSAVLCGEENSVALSAIPNTAVAGPSPWPAL
jgi:trimethylamine--corrinoid protein Co-methyltransferase